MRAEGTKHAMRQASLRQWYTTPAGGASNAPPPVANQGAAKRTRQGLEEHSDREGQREREPGSAPKSTNSFRIGSVTKPHPSPRPSRRQLTLTGRDHHGEERGTAKSIALSLVAPVLPDLPLRLPPRDIFEYHPSFFPENEARKLYRELAALPTWAVATLRVYNRDVLTPRLTCTYSLDGRLGYRYSNQVHFSRVISEAPAVARIRDTVQAWAGPSHHINYILLNYYRNGDDHVALHGDHLADMVGPVFSLSFQDTDDPQQLRCFDIVENATGHKERVRIANGSLMVMHRSFHVLYKHGVPKQHGVTAGRVNVTCRCMRASAHVEDNQSLLSGRTNGLVVAPAVPAESRPQPSVQ